MNVDFSEWFYYDESSPSCIRWKVNKMGGKDHKIVICPVDSVAGSRRTDGYWAVKLNDISYKCHRVVFELLTGEVPVSIDHVDGNNENNKISNLRNVSHRENCCNRKMPSSNTSGKTGVRFYTNAVGNSYWVASWTSSDNIRVHKCFSILKLGTEAAYSGACEYRDTMVKEVGHYTERHGT